MNSSTHLFFDLDRTLWDFDRNSQQALRILYADLQLRDKIPNFLDFYYKYTQINAELWVSYGNKKITKEELRNTRFANTLKKFKIIDEGLNQALSDGYIAISPDQTHVFPHALETLEVLKKEGFKLHIITNGFKEVQLRKVKNCGFDTYFDVIVCSEEIGKNKPDPAVFFHAMGLAGAEASKSVMIGDDFRVDILGASSAGMHTILFDPAEKYRNKKGNFQVKSLKEIPGLLPWVLRD
jgi:putative hydrolase of the HAD superfamily